MATNQRENQNLPLPKPAVFISSAPHHRMSSQNHRGGGHMACFIMSSIFSAIAILLGFPATPAAAFGGLCTSCQRQLSRCDGLLHKHRPVKQFTQNTLQINRDSTLFSTSSEFGAVSASSTPPRLNPALIDAAQARLPWERESNDKDEGDLLDEISSGQQWYETRQLLTRLWVLPRDMSNGSWEAYAIAANNGEDRMLSSVPQLLRLPPDEIERSAKTVLSVLKLPPALLRREPLLLTLPPDRLVCGFEELVCDEKEKMAQNVHNGDDIMECSDEKIRDEVREACKDTSGLLLATATKIKE